MTIGEMTIENRTDRVTLHGGVDLTRDRVGLERARRLRHILDAIVSSLESEEDLPEAVAIKGTTTVRNPFG
ncbi:hypothetical protein [Inquilinus sp. CAU 1745]|uniref:hypothetical protein n=1 Tax=Inquilinus sp. CAU 1745 TaxID=3140369 RepID=UPI00325B631E